MMKNKPVLGSGRKISNDPNNALLSVLLGLSCSEYFISNLIYQEQQVTPINKFYGNLIRYFENGNLQEISEALHITADPASDKRGQERKEE